MSKLDNLPNQDNKCDSGQNHECPRKTTKNKPLKVWFLIPLIVFFGLVVILYMRLGKPTNIAPNKALERPVPTFELPLLADTTRIITNNDLPDTPFLINVWGSWCPTCVIEHPFLMQLEERGVNIVGVNYKDEIGDALSYLNRGGDPFSMSVQDSSGQFALDLGLTGAPETFVVDDNKIIRQHIIGEINEDNWQRRVIPCLALLNDASKNNDSLDTSQLEKVCK